jgi:hypothetical protein
LLTDDFVFKGMGLDRVAVQADSYAEMNNTVFEVFGEYLAPARPG